jgi:hypothetical protein
MQTINLWPEGRDKREIRQFANRPKLPFNFLPLFRACLNSLQTLKKKKIEFLGYRRQNYMR